MDHSEISAPYKLIARAALDLVTSRTLIEALALLGLDWSPVPFNQMIRTSQSGLYTWVIGRGYEQVNLLDRPVAYIGVGTSKRGGLRGRLLIENNLIHDSAAHAHGRAMSRLQGSPLGGPIRHVAGADISIVEEIIRTSRFPRREAAIQKLRAWLSAPSPDVTHKAEQLCIRAAIHIGDTPPPLNSQFARAWGSYEPSDWGGWAVAQRLLTVNSAS